MNSIVQIPAIARTYIYYILGIANVTFISAQATNLGGGTPAEQWIDFGQQWVAGASALFFGVAAANVVTNKMMTFRGEQVATRDTGTVERPEE